MSEEARAALPQSARYANALFVAAGLSALALLFGSSRLRLWVCLAAGWSGSAFLLHFFFAYRRGARTALPRAPVAQGRIVERRESDGSISFIMQAAGTEPWANDAFVLWVSTCAAVGAGVILESGQRTLLGLLATLLAVLGLRLASAASDRLRLEQSTDGWSVDALAGGRAIQRSGTGALLPELLPDSLVLWSRDGRVGVLRGELEPEERAWLAERLAALVADSSAVATEPDREPHQGEADEHGQKQQAEGDQ